MLKNKKIPNKLGRRGYVFAVVAFAVVVFGAAILFAPRKTAAQSATGWAIGIWNDVIGYLNGAEQLSGIPAVGWLSSSSDLRGNGTTQKYSVVLAGNAGDIERQVSGSAWFGIGSQADSGGASQNDLPSLGWLDFGAGSPSFCSGGDCHGAMWHKQGSDIQGYLDGWARVRALGENGWLRLKGPNGNYSVTSNSDVLNGYAWNSGGEATIQNNSGLGWINLTGLKMKECNMACGTATYCPGQQLSSCQSNYCPGDGSPTCSLQSDKLSWSCSSGCGQISCTASPIYPETGTCGPLDGKSLCDPNTVPTNADMCASGSVHNFTRNAVTATWSCGSNQCGGSEASCSARDICGWIETTP